MVLPGQRQSEVCRQVRSIPEKKCRRVSMTPQDLAKSAWIEAVYTGLISDKGVRLVFFFSVPQMCVINVL